MRVDSICMSSFVSDVSHCIPYGSMGVPMIGGTEFPPTTGSVPEGP